MAKVWRRDVNYFCGNLLENAEMKIWKSDDFNKKFNLLFTSLFPPTPSSK
jgi:hypothetical protein